MLSEGGPLQSARATDGVKFLYQDFLKHVPALNEKDMAPMLHQYLQDTLSV
jgi:hypothetical protein